MPGGLVAELGVEPAAELRVLNGIGEIFLATGHPAQARAHHVYALTLYASLGTPEADQIRAQLATDCA